MKPYILPRDKYGQLTVLCRSGSDHKGNALWECRCSCGKVIKVRTGNLKAGTKSCGCLQKAKVTIHGHKGSPTYNTWRGMIQRCHNPLNRNFGHYGAQGVAVTERWRTSFQNFLDDMGERPEGKTLDRIDVYDHYYKENCRWAIPSEQAHNKRRPVPDLPIDTTGIARPIIDWRKTKITDVPF